MRSTTRSAPTGSATANSRSTGAAGQRLDAVDGQQRLAGVAGAPGAAQGQLPQPGGAQPGQLERRSHRDQGLVGADVGRRPLPADVLLPGAQGGDVGPPALDVDRLAHQPARAAGARAPGGRRTGPGTGPPKDSGVPKGWPSPTTTSAP